MRGAFERARAFRRLLRLTPFDTSTDEGRSNERYRRAGLTTFTSVAARVVTVITGLVTVRLTVRYLGTERYGLWMTVTSIVAMMSFADLGIGNGLLNSISEANGRDDRESVHRYVSSAFLVLLGIALLLIALSAIAYPLVPWSRVFNVSSPTAMREAGPAVLVFLVCFAINLPLDVVQRVQTGYQEGFETNLWTAGGNITAFICLLVAMHLRAGLPWLVLCMSGGPLVGVLGNWGHEFGSVRPWLVPAWRYWDHDAARKIMGTGVMFLILSVSGIFTATVDNVIIAQVLGSAAVTQYAVPMRLFLLLVSVASMFVAPLWPAYGEAWARGDVKWTKLTVQRSLQYGLSVFGPAALCLAVSGRLIVRIWIGNQVQPSYVLLFGMATWAVLAVLGNVFSIFLAGIGMLRFQVILAIVMAVANLLAKILLARSFGLSGVVWATVLTSVLNGVPLTWYTFRLLSRLPESSKVRESVWSP